MKVFLSYSRNETRLAESLAGHLTALGVHILAFEDVELIDDNLDYLRECNSVCVLYSRASLITHSVRLANRMTKRQLAGLVLIDEDWDADQNELDVFASFMKRRVQFDYSSITRGLRAFVGMLAKTPPIPKGFEVFEALLVDQPPESAPILKRPQADMSGSAMSDDFWKLLLARSGAEALHGTRLRPAMRLLGEPHGRRMSKPPDPLATGGLRAVLEAIEARQMRRSAPPAQTGDPASGADASMDQGGQDGDNVPLHPPPKTD